MSGVYKPVRTTLAVRRTSDEDYKSFLVPASLSPSRYSAGNRLQIPSISGRIELDLKIYSGNGPQLSDQLVPTSVGVVDYTAEDIYNTTCIVLWFDMNDGWLL